MGIEHWKGPLSAHNPYWMSGSTKGLGLGLVVQCSVMLQRNKKTAAVDGIFHLRFTFLLCAKFPFHLLDISGQFLTLSHFSFLK